jgi:hypothetical protein
LSQGLSSGELTTAYMHHACCTGCQVKRTTRQPAAHHSLCLRRQCLGISKHVHSPPPPPPPPLLSTIPIETPNLALQAVEMAVKRTIQSLSRSRASCLWTGHKVSIGMKRSRQNSTHCACAPSASGWPDSQKARSSPGNGSASRWGAHRQQDRAKRHQGRHTDSTSVIDRILASDGFVPVPP